MTFLPQNIDCQDLYQLKNLINGTEDGDSVAYRQLKPLEQDITNIFQTLSDLPNTLDTYRAAKDLQDEDQVLALIAQALQDMPDVESRLASVAVKTVYQGTLTAAQAAIASFNLTASDSGSIDDANVSCILLDSPTTGETGVYQLNLAGQLVKLNASMFAENLGYYTRFYAIESENRPGREFAVTGLDDTTSSFEVEEIPYTDEYAGLGPITVSNLNKTINLKFSALDFVVNDNGEFALLPALRQAIGMVPGLSEAVATLTVTVTDLVNTVQAQGLSISQLQTQVQGVLDKLSTAFANVQHVFFENGIAKIKDQNNSWTAAPVGFVQELAGGSADQGLFRINHNRGVQTLPNYFQADSLGNPKRMAAFLPTEDVSANSVDVWVEKYTTIVLSFPAGLTSSAFA